MIDNPEQVARLLGKLRNSLPVAALARPSLKAIIRENSSSANPISQYTVTRVDYAGDEGALYAISRLTATPGQKCSSRRSPIWHSIPGFRWRATSRPTRSIASSVCDGKAR
jgi:hypothetical protein